MNKRRKIVVPDYYKRGDFKRIAILLSEIERKVSELTDMFNEASELYGDLLDSNVIARFMDNNEVALGYVIEMKRRMRPYLR